MIEDVSRDGDEIIVDRPIPRERIRSVDRGVLVTCTATHCDWQGLFPDADLATTAAERHYDHEIRNGQYHYGSRTYLVDELLDGETACVLDTSQLGLSGEEQRFNTPSGEVREAKFPRTTGDVPEIVQRGDRIQIPPEREKKVYKVTETRSHGLPTWTVIYVDQGTDLATASKQDFYWLNELVAQDGAVYRSFGHDPLAAPAFEVVGETDHQADFSEFVARADDGNSRSVDTETDRDELMTDGGTDGTEQLTCPECGDPLEVDEEWVVTDRSLIGTTVEAGESIQGDYAHASCVGMETDRDQGGEKA